MANRRALLVLAAGGLLALGAFCVRRLKEDQARAEADLRWSEDVGFVRQARLRGFQPEDEKGGRALLDGHDIVKGDGVVLCWRRFGDDPAVQGEESFEMLTLELPDFSAAKKYRFGEPGVRGFYSRGSSAGGRGWHASDMQGAVWVAGLAPGTLHLSLDLRLPLRRSPEDAQVQGEILTLRRDLRCPRAPIETLTPWLRGQSPYRR